MASIASMAAVGQHDLYPKSHPALIQRSTERPADTTQGRNNEISVKLVRYPLRTHSLLNYCSTHEVGYRYGHIVHVFL